MKRRCVLVALAGLLALGGCGDDDDVDAGVPTTEAGAPGTSTEVGEEAGEPTEAPTDVSADRLVFLDVQAAELAGVLERYDGTVTQEVAEIGAVEVQFAVDSHDDLLQIRDDLRAEGYEVDVSVETDPTLDGASPGAVD